MKRKPTPEKQDKCPTCNGTGKVVTNNRTAIHDCPDCRVKVDTVAVDGATGGATVGPKNVIEITDFPMYSAHCANPDNCPVCQTMCTKHEKPIHECGCRPGCGTDVVPADDVVRVEGRELTLGGQPFRFNNDPEFVGQLADVIRRAIAEERREGYDKGFVDGVTKWAGSANRAIDKARQEGRIEVATEAVDSMNRASRAG